MRLVTEGNPADVLQEIGRAKNLMSRELDKMKLSGATKGQAQFGGSSVQLDANGINRVTIKTPVKDIPKEVQKETENDGVVVYFYRGKKYGAFSSADIKTVTQKSMRYFGNPPVEEPDELLDYQTIIILEPIRVLTQQELRIFTKLKQHGRRFVLFPGSDIAVFNAILVQLGSIFELVPNAAERIVGSYGKLPDGKLLYLPIAARGWIKVLNAYSNLAAVKDPFGRGLGFSNIVTVMPEFTYPPDTGVWTTTSVWGNDIVYLANLHYGGVSWRCNRNSLYPVGYALDDWSALSKTAFLAWLDSVKASFPMIIKAPAGHTYTTNGSGWRDFSDVAAYDFVSAKLAYYTKDNIMVAGFAPYWFNSNYNTQADSSMSTKLFSQWIAGKWGTTDVFSQMFYNMPPYLYSDYSYVPGFQW